MKIEFDFRDFDRAARSVGGLADQIPYALARSLNEAAEAARREIIQETWPQHVKVRNSSFLNAALTTKGMRATKRNLSVVIYDRLGRASLKLHERGGSKRPRGANLAVPNKTNARPLLRKGGMPDGLRPRMLPNSFIKQSKYGPVIFQRTGKYQTAGERAKAAFGSKAKGTDNRHLKAMYGLAPQVRIRADVPFDQTFERVMRREMSRVFHKNFALAMKTAFRK